MTRSETQQHAHTKHAQVPHGQAQVVVVGSFNVDHVWRSDNLPAPGATLSGEYLSGPGGKGFNQAIAAVRSGARTAFVCALGNDLGGHHARSLATAEAIDLRDEVGIAPTGSAGIFVDSQGRNSIVVGAGANAELSAEFIQGQHALIAGSAVVLAQLETPIDAAIAALRLGRETGRLTVLNPAPANAQIPAELLQQVDVLTPNETEAVALFRRIGERLEPDAIAQLESPKLHHFCRELLHGGTVIVTLGAAGSFVSHAETNLRGDETAWYRVPAESANAVDTTGAGDAFNGALATALALRPERPFAEHVRFANRYAALSTERQGAAVSMPRIAELIARYGDL
jgi:ribokinase